MAELVASIPLVLDRPRVLRFEFAQVRQAGVELEKRLGAPKTWYRALYEMANCLEQGRLLDLDLTVLSIVTWQGLLLDDPSLTLDTVEHIMPVDLVALQAIVMAILAAWQAQSPSLTTPGDQEAVQDRDPLVPSTGPASGSSPVSALDSALATSGV